MISLHFLINPIVLYLCVLSFQIRVLSASVKASKKLTKEQLVVLGWKDEHWNVLDKVTVRNLQNDLVSFEVLENYERYLLNTMAKYLH